MTMAPNGFVKIVSSRMRDDGMLLMTIEDCRGVQFEVMLWKTQPGEPVPTVPGPTTKQ